MTNASMKKVSNALSVFALALVLSVGAFASVAHAQEAWGDSYSYDGGSGGWGDSYSYDGGAGSWGDSYSYDGGTGGSNWGDSYSYDGGTGGSNWGDSYSYDGGNAWGDLYSTDGGYGDLYSYDGNTGGGNLYTYDGGGNLYSYDNGGFGDLYSYDGGNLYSYDGGNLYTADGGNLYTTDSNGYYVDEYMDQYAQQYALDQGYGSFGSYGGSYGAGSIGYSAGSFWQPSFSSTGGCTSCHSQTYTNPGCTYNCNPKPTPSPVCPSGMTGTYPNCKYPQPTPTPKPTCTTCGGGGSNITNVNTNTNTNTNIHTDSHNYSYTDNSYTNNSINGSFNTNISNSGNTHISTVTPVVPQQQLVYQYQQQIAAPFCTISLQNAGAYNAQATLVWSSSNATTAYISQIGSVAPNGSRSVTGFANQTYSLTVTGQGGTYTCVSQPFAPTYVPPAPINPSVSLTQIPYTGLALSPFAQAMYWLSIISVAAAGGYLLVYYKGGALALAGMTRRQNHFVVSEQTEQDSTDVETPVAAEEAEEVAAPVAHAFSLPTMSETKTQDSMQVIRNAFGVPQIIINRA